MLDRGVDAFEILNAIAHFQPHASLFFEQLKVGGGDGGADKQMLGWECGMEAL